ncbi:MAG: 4Fe-4S dicluster domain-containing protein [Eggerthellaceae bacterium]|nr:4Fe-4S dicluster domain-containing protein [Eggerthellaceae bacterium]
MDEKKVEEESSKDLAPETSAQETQSSDTPSPKKHSSVITRRSLLLGCGGAVVLLALGGLQFVDEESLVRPPGGEDEEWLINGCIRCEKCYEICPRHVISPAHLENGLVNMRVPQMNFNDNWCDWCVDENDGHPLCAYSCPTGALKTDEADAGAFNYKLGLAKIDENTCLAYRLTGCRFCYDICPFDAITLDNYNLPVVNDELCVGCGACESVCVSLQDASLSEGATQRAIVVYPMSDFEDGKA